MNSNWYVITGASCSGKTTLTEALREKGYKIIPETARVLIEEGISNGLSVGDIRRDEESFQKKVLELKVEIEKGLNKEEVIFLDRGIPDTIAYNSHYQFPSYPVLEEALKNIDYKKVFILDQLPYTQDDVRIESEEVQKKLHRLLKNTYRDLNFEIISVPAIPINERVDFVLKNL